MLLLLALYYSALDRLLAKDGPCDTISVQQVMEVSRMDSFNCKPSGQYPVLYSDFSVRTTVQVLALGLLFGH